MTLGNARTLEIRLAVGDKDVAALRGALLAARASELAEVRRRTARHSFGYGRRLAAPEHVRGSRAGAPPLDHARRAGSGDSTPRSTLA